MELSIADDSTPPSQRLNSQFGTAVVLTTVWVELVNDPKLFALKLVKTRDHRLLAVLFTFLGGMCSSGIVYASSSAVAFGACTGKSSFLPFFFRKGLPSPSPRAWPCSARTRSSYD